MAGGLLCIFEEYKARLSVFGCDGKGGEILKLTTKYEMDDIKYNREFQKFRYTSEIKSKMEGN